MNPAIIFKTAQLIFRLRKLIALAVFIEFAVKRQMHSKNSKKSKKSKNSDLTIHEFAEDALSRMQNALREVQKRANR